MSRTTVAHKTLPFLLLAIPGFASSQTTVTINLGSNRHSISPLIYGTAYPTTAQVQDLNCPVSRFGGNEASSYNWLQNAAAKGADYYYESWPNDDSSAAGEAVDSFISMVKGGGAAPMVTVPMLNYLGKVGPNRETLWSYSISKYGSQTGYDPWNGDAGNGVSSASGNPFISNDPSDANSPNSVAMQQSWLSHLLSTWGNSSSGGVKYYLMDNEPSIWHSTHRDVHPNGESYDEIYQDYVNYAGAVRAADPGAIIAGPEEWGWTGYFYSGVDQVYGAANGWGGTFPTNPPTTTCSTSRGFSNRSSSIKLAPELSY